MKELLRSNDLVWISWIEAALRDAGVEPLLMDAHASVLEGSAVAIPRRLMVVDEDFAAAREVLRVIEEESR
jgi:hypothetical protein